MLLSRVIFLGDSLCSKYNREKCKQTPKMDGPDLVEMNGLKPNTKLEWALEMAEAVALLHNHARGVIVHDDIQLSQFLISPRGHIKMGDFNRAEVRRTGHCVDSRVFMHRLDFWTGNLGMANRTNSSSKLFCFPSLCCTTKNTRNIADTEMERGTAM